MPVTQQKNTLAGVGTVQPKTKVKTLILPGPAELYNQQLITERRTELRKICADLCRLTYVTDTTRPERFVRLWQTKLWPPLVTVK